MSRSVNATLVSAARVLLLVILFVIGAALGRQMPQDLPPLICVEQLRTNHPQVPGVFVVTLLCKVDVRDQVELEPAIPDLGSRS